MSNKIYPLVIFEIRRTVRILFISMIIPISLLLFSILYQYLLASSLTPSSNDSIFILLTKLFKYLQQFLVCIYSIVVSSYLLHDQSVHFIVQISDNKYIPYIAKSIAAVLITSLLSVYFILLFSIFSSLFLQILPKISILLILTILTLFEILCFTALTFIGYTIFYRMRLDTQISFLFPVAILFILPTFIFSGIAYGVFPDLLNSLTVQYNLTMISNFLLPTIDNIKPLLGELIPSVIVCFSIVISAFGFGFILIKDFEYK